MEIGRVRTGTNNGRSNARRARPWRDARGDDRVRVPAHRSAALAGGGGGRPRVSRGRAGAHRRRDPALRVLRRLCRSVRAAVEPARPHAARQPHRCAPHGAALGALFGPAAPAVRRPAGARSGVRSRSLHGAAGPRRRPGPLHLDAVPGDEARPPLSYGLEASAACTRPAHHGRSGERVLPTALGGAALAAVADALEPRLPLPRLLPHLSRADPGATRGLVPARHVRRAHRSLQATAHRRPDSAHAHGAGRRAGRGDAARQCGRGDVPQAGMVIVRAATPSERGEWDQLVARFPNCRIVHKQAWVEWLEACGCGTPLYLVFERGGEIVGAIPGLLVRLGLLRLYGSPLPGWQTPAMGPVFDPARVSTHELIGALVPFLERRHRVHHIELLSGHLVAGPMQALGFRAESVPTYRAKLYPGDEARMMKALKESARRNIRRAAKLGLVARIEDDEAIVAEHYAQLQEVFVRGGNTGSVRPEGAREFFRPMRAAGKLRAVSVYLPEGG